MDIRDDFPTPSAVIQENDELDVALQFKNKTKDDVPSRRNLE